MKINYNNRAVWNSSGRRTAGLPAIFLMLSLALATPFAGNHTLAQSTGKGTSEGQADGRLTIDGKVTELKYAYARQRNFPPPAPQGVIDLLLTNQSLAEEQLTRILEIKSEGADKVKGLWMMFDGEGKYLSERLLLPTGPTLAGSGVVMSMMDGNQNTKVANGKITGKIEANIQSPGRTTSFVVSFNAPLKPRMTEAAKTPANPAQLLREFQNILPGKWAIERWKNDRGSSYKGALTVGERLGEDGFRGILQLIYDDKGSTFDEEVTVRREGTKIQINGKVAPGVKWNADILTFELKNDLLTGGGTDAGGFLMDVVLRKIR